MMLMIRFYRISKTLQEIKIQKTNTNKAIQVSRKIARVISEYFIKLKAFFGESSLDPSR